MEGVLSGKDELWRDLNYKWAPFTQTREPWKRGVLREVVGHFMEATDSLKRSGAYELYLTDSIIAYQSIKWIILWGSCEHLNSIAIVPLRQENRRTEQCFHMYTYGTRDGDTWEKWVCCHHEVIRPSSIKQLMKPSMMQTLYLHHIT